MTDLLTLVTPAEARDAADVLLDMAREIDGPRDATARANCARAEAFRRVAEWIKQEAMK